MSEVIDKNHPRIKARREELLTERAARLKRAPASDDPDFPRSAEAVARDDLVVKALDHEKIWARYNNKAGHIQKVVPAKLEGE